MTDEEAKKVCEIMMGADGNCPYCASELLRMFVKEYPEKTDLARNVWASEYDSDLMEKRK